MARAKKLAVAIEAEELDALRDRARHCTACPLWERATQVVFGEGASGARIMLVGEQPGNDEDLAGHPFVGPAGRMLDRALVAAGIERSDVYVTDAVKHFKWLQRGKRRLHQRPNAGEVRACSPWLEAEVRAVSPQLLVCLGATASQAVFGSAFRVSTQRGVVLASRLATHSLATAHPSSLLRAPTAEARERELQRFIADLATAARFVRQEPARSLRRRC